MIYLKSWFESSNGVDAPINDIKFIQQLQTYKRTDEADANTAIQKAFNHLEYLSEENVGLAFFSEKISPKEKAKMLTNLHGTAPFKKDNVKVKQNILSSSNISNYVSQRTSTFFNGLDLPLSRSQSELDTINMRVADAKVINDCAERMIKVATYFNNSITNNSEEKQLALQVIEHHWKMLPFANKSYYML